jgi:phosphoketolase
MKSIERRDFLKGTATGVFAFTVGGVEVVLSAREARAQNVPFRLLKANEAETIGHAGLELRLCSPEPINPKKHDLNMMYITGPGQGGPGLVANAYLEGTYSEVYPKISPDEFLSKRATSKRRGLNL